MRIAIAASTGHIGSRIVEHLLDAGAKVVLLCRDPKKVEVFTRRGAQVERGSLEDVKFLNQATRGVDALFWMTPPNYKSEDFRAWQNKVGRAAQAAIRENQIPRVVNLSSAGAQLDSGVGPIGGLHDVEKLLDEVCPNVTHLRPGFFFENFLMQVEHMKHESCLYGTVSGTREFAMVATQDIARIAADRLLDERWTGRSVRGIHGPTDLSYEEAVKEISKGIGRPIRYVQVAEQDVRSAMISMGLSAQMADLLLEMYRAADRGLLIPAEPRTHETTTPTKLEDFAREVLAPVVAGEVYAGA